MKKFLASVLIFVMLMACVANGLAVNIQMDRNASKTMAPTAPLVTPDPRVIKAGTEREDLVQNGENEDTGTVWVTWSGKARTMYGCTTMSMRYTNPTRSNIGVTLKVAIMDDKLLKYFGTTFKSEEMLNTLALGGLTALNEGIKLSPEIEFRNLGKVFEGINIYDLVALDKTELCKILGKKGFLGMDEEALNNLDEETVLEFNEVQKLELAQLCGYNFETNYCEIAEAGLINPGFKLCEIDLHTLPNRGVLPKGEYEATYVLNGFDASKNEFSDFDITLPVDIMVKEDLPEEMQRQYGVFLLERVDN